MATQSRDTLKTFFKKGAIPTQQNFADFIDSVLNLQDDGVHKLPQQPLSLAAGDSGDKDQPILRLYLTDSGNASNGDVPHWTIGLTRSDAPDPPGFYMSDTQGTHRLFIDLQQANVGIGSPIPKESTGTANTAVGHDALGQNTQGSSNTAAGMNALKSNTGGNNNTALGADADVAQPDLSNATAIGAGAKVATSNTIVLGNETVEQVITHGRVGIGKTATDQYQLDVDGNVNASAYFLNGASLSTSPWQETDSNIFRESGNVGIGTYNPSATLEVRKDVTEELGPILRINNFGAGKGAGGAIDFNGYDVGDNDPTFRIQSSDDDEYRSHLLFLGKESASPESNLREILRITGDGNVSIGTDNFDAQLKIAGNFELPATTATIGIIKSGGKPLIHSFGTDNFFAGTDAGNLTMTGSYNTAAGREALTKNTTGSYNTATGRSVLMSNTTGNNNTAAGVSALQANTEGNNNTAAGLNALQANTTGNNNTAAGLLALYANTTGSSNMAAGYQALTNTTTGNNNTAVGPNALVSNTEGSNNTAIGNGADVAAPNLSNATAIGAGAKVATSNTIVLGNAEVEQIVANGNVAIGFKDPQKLADIVGMDVVDQLFHPDNSSENTGQNTQAQWQSFTAGKSGPLTAIEIFADPNKLTGNLKLYAGEGIDRNKLLVEQSIDSIHFSANDWHKFAFDSPIRIEAGHQYTFSFEDLSDGLYWNYGSGYPNGKGYWPVKSDDFDFMFRTYVQAATLVVDGSVGIGTTTPSHALDVQGEIASNGNVLSSDLRWKKNIIPLSDALATIMELRGVGYEWRMGEFPEKNFRPGRRLGIIAQDVEAMLPEIVLTDSDGYKLVDYASLSALLIEAIKEQKMLSDAQEVKIAQLQSRLETLSR